MHVFKTGCIIWANNTSIEVKVHDIKIRNIDRIAPDILRFTLNFLKRGSRAIIDLPIHLIGCGKDSGSPKIRSRIKAAKIIYKNDIGKPPLGKIT